MKLMPAPTTWQNSAGMPDHHGRPRRVWATMKPTHGDAPMMLIHTAIAGSAHAWANLPGPNTNHG